LNSPIAISALPFAAEEARQIAGELMVTALVGHAAIKAAVLARLRTAPVLHIATHGFVHEVSGKSELLLHDPANPKGGTLLTEDELDPAELQLSARLVMLPACHSGRGQQWTGEGLVGLGRALLACGAPTVLLSRWSLPDKQAADLMKRFYELLAVGDGGPVLAEAVALLRTATRAVPGEALRRPEQLPGEAPQRRWMD
jgi:CHAT domain-containing protein